jgi:hypothetical protein
MLKSVLLVFLFYHNSYVEITLGEGSIKKFKLVILRFVITRKLGNKSIIITIRCHVMSNMKILNTLASKEFV